MNLFENMLPPLTQVVFLVAVGAACRIKGVFTNYGTSEISKFILNVTLPVMLFLSGAQSNVTELAHQGPIVFLAGIVCPLLGFGIGAAVAGLFKLPHRQATVVRIGAALSNTAFVGIPVCTALWGAQGALLAAIYDQGINFPLLLLAPHAYRQTSHKNLWKELWLAPMVWGLALGILWNILGIGLPPWVETSLTVIGNVTLPLSLVMIGALTIPTEFARNILRPLTAFLLSRLVLVPIAVWTLALILGWNGTSTSVIILQTAMPASVTATVMAQEYGAEANLAASGAMFSVLLSLVTLPFVAMLALGR